MKNIDVPLSEEIASQAGKEINSLKNTIENNKDLQNEILRDYTNDTRIANKFIKKICVSLVILLFFTIAGIIGISIYNQNLIKKTTEKHNQQMMDFLISSELETTMEIVTDTQSTNHGNISLNK